MIEISGLTAILPIAVICLAVGYVVKHLIPGIDNKYIPSINIIVAIILGIIGYTFNILDMGSTDIYTAIANSVISAISSVGIHQTVYQYVKKYKVEDSGDTTAA